MSMVHNEYYNKIYNLQNVGTKYDIFNQTNNIQLFINNKQRIYLLKLIYLI